MAADIPNQINRIFHNFHDGRGKPKSKGTNQIHGRRTLREQIRIATKAATDMRVQRVKNITPIMAQNYLEKCRDKGLSQKYLSSIKCALERIVFIKNPDKKLESVKALPRKQVPLTDRDRAYTNDQIRLILSKMTEAEKLSTIIAHNAGLRAEELLTLRRINESSASTSRKWSDLRFSGRPEGVRYIVTGKNGLRREVLLDKQLAQILESKRLPVTKTIFDRQEKFDIQYDIVGGNKFSVAFSRASTKALGWSHGAHGLRFSYAQQRIDNELKHFTYSEAKAIVSQELGHFRENITDRYVEPYGKQR